MHSSTHSNISRPNRRTPWRALAAVGFTLFLLSGAGLLSGCGGGGATYQASSNTTLGRELQDLQETYDKGIITKKEYEAAKKRLIKKYTD